MLVTAALQFCPPTRVGLVFLVVFPPHSLLLLMSCSSSASLFQQDSSLLLLAVAVAPFVSDFSIREYWEFCCNSHVSLAKTPEFSAGFFGGTLLTLPLWVRGRVVYDEEGWQCHSRCLVSPYPSSAQNSFSFWRALGTNPLPVPAAGRREAGSGLFPLTLCPGGAGRAHPILWARE